MKSSRTVIQTRTLLKSQCCRYLLHFGYIGQHNNIAEEPILLILATLRSHQTMSPHSSRDNLADVYYTSGTLDHITTWLKSQSC
eukprot:7057465-Karenia_brevis.AAC.1